MSVFKRTGMVAVFVVFGALFASNAFALVTVLTPEEGQVFYGSTATLLVKLQHTPGYDVGLWFEATPLSIPGSAIYSWEHETVQTLNKNEVSPEITTMTVLIPKGGNWRVRASEQPKQPASPGITGPWREFLVIAPGQETVAATVNASPMWYTGKCPVQVYFNGKVGSAVKGNVQYQFIRSWDSTVTPVETLQFDGPGAVDVTTNFPVDPQKNPSIPASGWIAIRFWAHGQEHTSKHAEFAITCEFAIEPELMNIIKATFGGWKTLGKLSPPPQACQECVSTYKQIAGIDQTSLPLLQEGEGLAAGAGQDQAKAQRLNQIKSRLDLNMIQRNGLLNQYKSQITGFEKTRKQPVSPAERKGLNPQPEPPAPAGRTVR